MYSAEPLPHFVDGYLAWLHETHPTNATFDGVHLHDDLLEDLSRPAIEAQVRDLGGFARRLAGIDPARLTDTERLERPALDANIRARLFELDSRVSILLARLECLYSSGQLDVKPFLELP